jgi:hypothetical protein
MGKKLLGLGWRVATILLGSLGGAILVNSFRDTSNRDDGFGIFVGLIFSLTALAIYLHKLRPRQVYLSNRARAEALARAGFTE